MGRPSLELACHFGLVLAVEIAIFEPPGALDRCLESAKMAQSHALPCIGLWYGALNTFQVGRASLAEACHVGLVFAIEIAIFGPSSTWIGTWSG